MNLNLIETFSGAGMQRRGIENTGLFNVNSVATCELDVNAIISYAAIHCGLTPELVETYEDYPSREEMAQWLIEHRIGYDFTKDKEFDWNKKIKSKSKDIEKVWLACKLSHNYGDIAMVQEFPKAGMLTFSFPCTDISIAGKQKGFAEGETRSGLVWEVVRILKNMKNTVGCPNFLLMENVDALVNKKNLPLYLELNRVFKEELGYNCVYDVLNAKWCGVPQNRNRVFAIYALDKIDISSYEFPKKFDNGLRLKDILEDDVDEKYYINNSKAQALIDELILNGTLTEEDYEE